MNKPYAIVQARMDSKRLPGKVLREAKGKPLLEYVIERLAQSKNLEGTIVATSIEKTDDPIFQYCTQKKIKCYRGSLDNVASRFFDLLNEFRISVFVRISADSPLIDSRLVDQAIEIFKEGDFDLVTNVLKRTFPKGQSVEVVSAKRFTESFSEMASAEELEHVTKYFYTHPTSFKISNFTAGNQDYSKINFCVDTQDDFNQFLLILERMTKPYLQYSWLELVNIFKNLKSESPVCLN